MNEMDRIQNLLSKLEERMIKGEISQRNYEQLRKKLENKLQVLQEKFKESKVSRNEAIINEAMDKVVTKVYACDHCGGILDVREGVSKAKCLFCGYVNEIDYIRQISERVRLEKAEIIKGAMESFSKVTNFEQLKLPLHERFLATAHIYESRALRFEDDLRPSFEYSEATFRKEREYFTKIEDQRQFYEASKSWHQVAELYRNAAEFATNDSEKKSDLTSSNFYDGLAFFDVSFAPIRLMKNTFYIKMYKGSDYSNSPWFWGDKREMVCETVQDLLIVRKRCRTAFESEDLWLELKKMLPKVAHPFLIRKEAVNSSLLSSIKATQCFLNAFKISDEKRYLIYALVSKMLVYILFAESFRGKYLTGSEILRKIYRICYEELYAPQSHRKDDPVHDRDERSLKYASILRGLIKKFALFGIAYSDDFILGFEPDFHESRRFDISQDNKILSFKLMEYPDKIDKSLSQKTGTYTLIYHKLLGLKEDTQKNVGFKFSWSIAKYKSGFLTYYEPGIYLAIESAKGQKGSLGVRSFFEEYFDAFNWFAGSPIVLLNILNHPNAEKIDMNIEIHGEKDWILKTTINQYVNFYSSLCLTVSKLRNNKIASVQKYWAKEIGFVQSWKEKVLELKKKKIPKNIDGEDSPVLTTKFLEHDLALLSFFAENPQDFAFDFD